MPERLGKALILYWRTRAPRHLVVVVSGAPSLRMQSELRCNCSQPWLHGHSKVWEAAHQFRLTNLIDHAYAVAMTVRPDPSRVPRAGINGLGSMIVWPWLRAAW